MSTDRRHRLSAFGLVALLVLACAATASAATAKVQYQSAETQFMCTTCHEPLPQVNSPQADAEKAYLAQLVDHGYTMGQIKAIMEEVYGVAVLARPPASGFNALIYILPPVAVILALLTLVYTLPKWRARAKLAARAPAAVTQSSLTVEESARLDEELKRFV